MCWCAVKKLLTHPQTVPHTFARQTVCLLTFHCSRLLKHVSWHYCPGDSLLCVVASWASHPMAACFISHKNANNIFLVCFEGSGLDRVHGLYCFGDNCEWHWSACACAAVQKRLKHVTDVRFWCLGCRSASRRRDRDDSTRQSRDRRDRRGNSRERERDGRRRRFWLHSYNTLWDTFIVCCLLL